MFNAADLVPGEPASTCIQITYTGNLASSVRLYGTGETATKSLDTHLNLTIEQGTGGTFGGGCAGFAPDAGAPNSWTGAPNAFAATFADHAGGFGTFSPTGAVLRGEDLQDHLHPLRDDVEHQPGRHSRDWAHVGSRRHFRRQRNAVVLDSNADGQVAVGDGNVTQVNWPRQVATDTNWGNVSSGGGHVCATRTDRPPGAGEGRPGRLDVLAGVIGPFRISLPSYPLAEHAGPTGCAR